MKYKEVTIFCVLGQRQDSKNISAPLSFILLFCAGVVERSEVLLHPTLPLPGGLACICLQSNWCLIAKPFGPLGKPCVTLTDEILERKGWYDISLYSIMFCFFFIFQQTPNGGEPTHYFAFWV